MLIASILASFALSTGSTPRPPQDPAPARAASVEFLFDYLSPFGTWIEHPTYSWVWHPHDVEPTWHPYLHGRWGYTDLHGWTWVSDHVWGWGPCHYGRWVLEPEVGWLWIPGTVWAPAWVAWGAGAGCFGWTPLPFEAGWDAHVGLQVGQVDLGALATPSWVFVEERAFLHPRIHEVAVEPGRAEEVLLKTRIEGGLEQVDRRVFARGIDVSKVEKATGVKVLRKRPIDAGAPAALRPTFEPGTVPLYRPRVVGSEEAPPPPWNLDRALADEVRRFDEAVAAEKATWHEQSLPSPQGAAERKAVEAARRERMRELERVHQRQRAQLIRRQEMAR